MSNTRKKMEEALADIKTYGERSANGLGRMRDGIRGALQSVKTPLDPYAEDITSWLPGYSSMEGTRLGAKAGRLWNDGRHGRALVTMGEALEAPMNDLFWFAPGAGLIRKVK